MTKRHRKFTPRGFEDFAELTDTHGSHVVVRESSSISPAVWIFTHARGCDTCGAHLSVDQALTVAKALVDFAKRHVAAEQAAR